MLTKKKLQDLVREVDPNEQLDEDVEEVRRDWVPQRVCPWELVCNSGEEHNFRGRQIWICILALPVNALLLWINYLGFLKLSFLLCWEGYDIIYLHGYYEGPVE